MRVSKMTYGRGKELPQKKRSTTGGDHHRPHRNRTESGRVDFHGEGTSKARRETHCVLEFGRAFAGDRMRLRGSGKRVEACRRPSASSHQVVASEYQSCPYDRGRKHAESFPFGY